jgi:hypothetical protein
VSSDLIQFPDRQTAPPPARVSCVHHMRDNFDAIDKEMKKELVRATTLDDLTITLGSMVSVP